MAALRRGHGVFVQIARANADLCANAAAAYIGAMTTTIAIFPRDLQEAARKVMGAGDGVVVHYVAPDSPAQRAGLAIGDRIVSVNGAAIATGTAANNRYNRSIRTLPAANPVATIAVERGGAPLNFTVTAETSP